MAESQYQPAGDPLDRGELTVGTPIDANSSPEIAEKLASSSAVQKNSLDEYVHFQRRIFFATIVVSAIAVSISFFWFPISTSSSLLIGALCGVLYLRLLARSVGKLGKSSKTVSKIQLVIPVLLVLGVSKLPQLDLLPSLLGFLLYKPSLILQVMLESSNQEESKH